MRQNSVKNCIQNLYMRVYTANDYNLIYAKQTCWSRNICIRTKIEKSFELYGCQEQSGGLKQKYIYFLNFFFFKSVQIYIKDEGRDGR